MKEYIPIKQMHLNLWKDGASPTRQRNELQSLKNYQCKPGVIFTRKGITLFTHTASTEPVPFPEGGTYTIGAETAVCCVVLKFDNAADLGHNYVTSAVVNPLFCAMVSTNYSGGATNSTLYSKQGTSSLLITNVTATNSACGNPARFYGLSNITSTMPDWLPGVSTTAKSWLITMWIRPHLINGGEEDYWRFGDVTNPCIIFRHHNGGELQAYWYDQLGGATNEQFTCLTQSAWHFVACWRHMKKGHTGLYAYNDALQTEVWTANSVNLKQNFRTNTERTANAGTAFDVGAATRVLDPSEAFHGNFDYVTMWNNLFIDNTSNLTLAKAVRDLHKSP